MKGFSRWQRMDRLERRLRDDRPVAPSELLDEVVRRLEGSRPVPSTRVTFRRLGLAGGAAATMLAVFAAFGGVGFAASGASDAASSTVDAILTIAKPAKSQTKLGQPQSQQPVRSAGVSASGAALSSTSQLVAPTSQSVAARFGNCGNNDSVGAANGQYCPPRVTICHHHHHNKQTLTLPSTAAFSHLLHHPRDSLGHC